jgi:uncharacterized protein
MPETPTVPKCADSARARPNLLLLALAGSDPAQNKLVPRATGFEGYRRASRTYLQGRLGAEAVRRADSAHDGSPHNWPRGCSCQGEGGSASIGVTMAETSYYVYALKDTRTSPAKPFYIGKGTGTRAHDHLARPDDTRKGARIREIVAAGHHVLVSHLVEDISEVQAIKIEAELIAAYGTEATGGPLTNSVIPSGLVGKARRDVVVPHGVQEKAQVGLQLLKSAVLEFAKANRKGITNSDAASLLGLRSDYGGASKDYLSYSLLGLLMRDGLLRRDGSSKRHVATTD